MIRNLNKESTTPAGIKIRIIVKKKSRGYPEGSLRTFKELKEKRGVSPFNILVKLIMISYVIS